MSNKGKNILIFIIVSLSLFSSFFIFFKDRKVLATIDNKKIYKSELNEYLVSSYGNTGLTELVNRKIITMEAESNNISYTNEELENESLILKSLKDSRFDIAIPKNEEYIKRRILTKKLMRNTIDDKKLKDYYEQGNLEPSKSYTIDIYKAENIEELELIVDSINSGEPLTTYIDKLENLNSNQYDDCTEPFGIYLFEAQKNDAYHIEFNNEDAIAIISDINSGTPLDFETDKEEILDSYLNNYYSEEYINFMNKLQEKYAISLDF